MDGKKVRTHCYLHIENLGKGTDTRRSLWLAKDQVDYNDRLLCSSQWSKYQNGISSTHENQAFWRGQHPDQQSLSIANRLVLQSTGAKELTREMQEGGPSSGANSQSQKLQHSIQFYYMTALAFVPLHLTELIMSLMDQASPVTRLLFRVSPSRVYQYMLACSSHA